MKALVAPSYGPIDQLTLADVPNPAPGPGQIVLRVEAAALNPLDAKLATGVMQDEMPVKHPFVLGLDATGVVEEVGSDVRRFDPGDEVVAFTYGGSGAVAEFALVNDGPFVTRRPSNVDSVSAAALPVAAMTAAGATEAASLEPDRSVLIVGATGGIGSFAIQMAAGAGAKVFATAGPADDAWARRLGADHTIDYTTADTTQQLLRRLPDGVDTVIDLVNAGPALAATAAAARAGGRLVSPLGGPTGLARGVTAHYVRIEARDGLLDDLVAQVADDRLAVEVGATYPFAEAPAAMTDLVGKHTRGKIVITL